MPPEVGKFGPVNEQPASIPSMRARARQQRRARLVLRLGGHCAVCGAVEGLQFDMVVPTNDGHHKLGADDRLRYYRKCLEKGVGVQLLCVTCHNVKSTRDTRKRRVNPQVHRRCSPSYNFLFNDKTVPY
jgi:5-methylcytosine-specific restriction endonuclease McrA